VPFPDFEPTIPTLLRTAVERYRDRTLVVHGERRANYGDVERQSALLARGLLASGVGKGTRVGLLMPNGPDWIVAFFAAARIGALVVPINTFFQARELAWVLRHADVQTLLTAARFRSHDYLARLEECAPDLRAQPPGRAFVRSLPFLRDVIVFGDCDRAWARSAASAMRDAETSAADDELLRSVEAQVTPADALVIIYTSGSTAEPRGAIHTHGTAVRHGFNVSACAGRNLTADDRIWSPMPFFWVGGLVMSLVAATHVGACLLCEDAFDAEKTLDLLERERATIAAGWPHYGKAMASHPSFARRDLSSLRAGLADILPPDKRPPDPDLRTNSLGMTETCGPHTFGRESDPPHTLRGSFGRAVDAVEHRVIDPETGVILEPGVEGEICVRGYSLMQGFYKVERERTFERDGFYRTGDGGSFDREGFLWFKGRLGDMIKTAGANVAPSEVEAVLDSFPEVRNGYVVGVPDPARGQNVAAAIVLKSDGGLDAATVRERLRAQLAAYKVPRSIFFYDAADLPFTDSGKIDKRKLRDLLAARIAGEAARS